MTANMRLWLAVILVLVCAPSSVPADGYARRQPDDTWSYKHASGRDLGMFVFFPEGYASRKGPFPVFVAAHGGSWNAGTPAVHYPDCAYWASRGMVAVSVEYRLRDRDKVQVPLECIKDVKSSIRFLRKNADRLKIDPDRIVVGGDSVGGQLAAATAMVNAEGADDEADDLSISCVPNAVMCYNPWFKCPAPLSPPGLVRPGLPPMIIFHGDQDPTPVDEIVEFRNDMLADGNVVELHVGIGGKHGFCNGRNPRNAYFYEAAKLADRFLVTRGILAGSHAVKAPVGLPDVHFVLPGELSTEPES